MISRVKGYGRYVDDFIIIDTNKNNLLNTIHLARQYLKNNLLLTLHPTKIYIQEVKKGIPFIGTIIKPKRCYSKNRLITNAFKIIDNSKNINVLICRANSYLGFLRKTNSYNIRKRFCLAILSKYGEQVYVKGRFEIIAIKNKYKENININKIIHNQRYERYTTLWN